MVCVNLVPRPCPVHRPPADPTRLLKSGHAGRPSASPCSGCPCRIVWLRPPRSHMRCSTCSRGSLKWNEFLGHETFGSAHRFISSFFFFTDVEQGALQAASLACREDSSFTDQVRIGFSVSNFPSVIVLSGAMVLARLFWRANGW